MKPLVTGVKVLITVALWGVFIIAVATTAINCVSDPVVETNLLGGGVYIKDPRTKLCFFSRYSAGNNAVLTNVPCTEAVEREIASEAKEAAK